ncbi:MAG: SCP2 sterol-binding domain-containing protein [Candidatus Lokiarchaeota archaeon]|nr:SCP2 sterol-binding domain-containing protein [Candidatus Lokiarchaeota archaeon]
MVDEALLKKIKAAQDAGASAASAEEVMLMYEFTKQISLENEDLKEELEDMDIAISQILTDIDKKYWLTVKEGKLDFGEGDVENPSFTMSSTLEVGAGILMGEVDATSAYMAGDITVEGNLQDAMAFQEIIELALEAYEDLIEDL